MALNSDPRNVIPALELVLNLVVSFDSIVWLPVICKEEDEDGKECGARTYLIGLCTGKPSFDTLVRCTIIVTIALASEFASEITGNITARNVDVITTKIITAVDKYVIDAGQTVTSPWSGDSGCVKLSNKWKAPTATLLKTKLSLTDLKLLIPPQLSHNQKQNKRENDVFDGQATKKDTKQTNLWELLIHYNSVLALMISRYM